MDVAIFDDLTVLGDATRSRLLLLLERHEMTVGELCAALQLPQSTVSRHLKVLLDSQWVTSRREGTSRYYGAIDPEAAAARRLWQLLREQVTATSAAEHDARRATTIVARRRTASVQFFESAAGRWDKLRAELFGHVPHLLSLAGLLDEDWVVGDLGCGTGQLAATVAPFVSRVIAVDRSADMLQSARRRLRELANVELRRGDLEALPITSEALDAATLLLVLHHIPDPSAVLADVARVLKPGGRLLIVDMLPHDREEYRQQMGHIWLGFAAEQVRKFLSGAGFQRSRVVPLPPDPESKGPGLFVANARK